MAARRPDVNAKLEALRAAKLEASRRVTAAIAEYVEIIMAAQSDAERWISHRDSPIGTVTFARLCRAGVAADKEGYYVVGRRYYMTPERHAEALRELSHKRVRKAPEKRQSVTGELHELLRCVKGGRW